ncbi:unnamed protein product [Rotaria sordida]|uniref:Uncharacterized protein n=1 Tax=Rotaria sordida TaxID=392033 RepID=A0A815GWA6_9BILA|nr:unnamed protein product [Rotaria sordida]
MAYAPLPALDDLSNREWNELTSNLEKTINLCQQLGLLHVYPTKPCSKMHNNWYLGACSTALDECKRRCRTCKSSRSLRKDTFFEDSRLTLQQILDLMMYWCQGLDSHKFISYLITLDVNNNPLQVDMNIFMKSNGELKNMRQFMSLVESYLQCIRAAMQKELSNRTIIVPQAAQQNAQGATYIACPNCPQDSGQYVPCPQCQYVPHIQHPNVAQ